MKYYQYFFAITLLISIPINLVSQPKLSDADLQEFKKQANLKIKSFEYFIRQILSDETNRSVWIEEALRLFNPDATIQVAGKKSGVSEPIKISEYLSQKVPKYAKNYGVVVIDFIAINVGNFKEKKHDNGKIYYEAKIKFKQRFCRSAKTSNGDDEIVEFEYCDKTEKGGTIVLEQKTNRKGNYWQLLLGNINVESISD